MEMPMRKIALIFLASFLAAPAFAQDIELPSPNQSGGCQLMQAISQRKSTRNYREQPITLQQLSDILWAAAGKSRGDRRTVPSALNRQEVQLYVFTKDGNYRYDAEKHRLLQISKGDFRATAGLQPYVKTAALNIMYVFDETRAGGDDPKNRIWAAVSAGAMTQNVSLYCASEKLGTVVRGSFDSKAVSLSLRLNARQIPILSQSIGVPAP